MSSDTETFAGHVRLVNTTAVLWFLSMFLIWATGLNSALSNWRDYQQSSAASAKHVELKNNAKNVEFKLPGIEFKVKSYFAPVAWNCASLGFLWFLVYQRRRAHLYATRSAAVIKARNGEYDNTYIPPWWLAPIPKYSRGSVSSEDIREYLRWGVNQRHAEVIVRTFCLVLLALQIQVTWMSWLATKIFIPSSALGAIILSVSVLSVVATIGLCYHWLADRQVLEYSYVEKIPAPFSRRSFVILAVSGAAALTVGPARYLGAIINRVRAPRYKIATNHKSRAVTLRTGLWRRLPEKGKPASYSKFVHIVSQEGAGYFPGDSEPSPDNFEIIEPRKLIELGGARYHGSKGLKALEDFVVSMVISSNANYDLAVDMLISGIYYDLAEHPTSTGRPSYRLYDLAAGLAFRHDTASDNCVSHLGSLISIAGRSSDKRLRYKAKRWKDQDPAWVKKWGKSNVNLLWAGVPM